MVHNMQKEIELLNLKLDSFESLQAGKCCECESEIEEMAQKFYEDVRNKLNNDNFNKTLIKKK